MVMLNDYRHVHYGTAADDDHDNDGSTLWLRGHDKPIHGRCAICFSGEQ